MRIDGNSAIQAYGQAPVAKPVPVGAARPAGDLTSVLSADELNYFAELDRLGPLTYGRNGKTGQAHAPPPVLGQRLDVRA